MRYKFEASKDFIASYKNIRILLKYSSKEDKKGNDTNRNLFLKLSLVLLVTRFQVFVESVLKEFDYNLKNSGKHLHQMPNYYRLNSFRKIVNTNPIHKQVENLSVYSQEKIKSLKEQVDFYHQVIDNQTIIDSKFHFDTKFPMGKSGLSELVNLFKQIEGVNIFDSATFDINKINEILRRRHDIIHEDKNQQITEVTIENYYFFLINVVAHIDSYLKPFLLKKYKPSIK